jgi:hypothetical protein
LDKVVLTALALPNNLKDKTANIIIGSSPFFIKEEGEYSDNIK